MRAAIFWSLGIVFVWGIVFHACKKEKIIIQGSRTDTIYIQYEHCQYDTSLPINCYTTHLRSGAQRFGAGKEDTIVMYESQCITLGHCKFDEFFPYYKLCFEGPSSGRIPDTAMCRAAGIPLCCPTFMDYPDDLPVTDIDILTVWLRKISVCSVGAQWLSFSKVGQTRYLEHPDSNPNFSCQSHLQSLFPDSIQNYKFKNCSIRLIEYPQEFDYDTITIVYAPQGPGGSLIPCCAGDFSNPPLNVYAKIGLQCN